MKDYDNNEFWIYKKINSSPYETSYFQLKYHINTEIELK